MQKLKVELVCDICGATTAAYVENPADIYETLPPQWFFMRVAFPRTNLERLPQYACSAQCAGELTVQLVDTLYFKDLPPQFARIGSLFFYVGDPVEEVSDEPKAAE